MRLVDGVSGADIMSAMACEAIRNSTAKMPNGSSQRGRSGTAGVSGYLVLTSILNHMLEGEQCTDEEHDIEHNQHPQP